MFVDVKDLSSQCDTDAELQEHRKRIQLLSEETALSLKKNVYKNYMQFIETSKEISCIFSLEGWFRPLLMILFSFIVLRYLLVHNWSKSFVGPWRLSYCILFFIRYAWLGFLLIRDTWKKKKISFIREFFLLREQWTT